MQSGSHGQQERRQARLAYTIAIAGVAVLLTGAVAVAYANSGALILDLATSAATFFCL